MLKRLFSLKQPFLVLLLLGLEISLLIPRGIASSSDSLHFTATAESICPSDLENAINTIIQRPEYERSYWGIQVQTLNGNHTLYSLNSQKYFIPASNVKLLTSAAALLQFSPIYRIHTPIYATGSPPYLETLYMIGRGDPTITTQKLQELAQQLKQKGVRQINQLIVENNYLSQTGINPTWEWEDIFYSYAVPTNSLILNENIVTLKALPQQVRQPLKLMWSDPIAARQWKINNQTLTASKGTKNSLEIKGFLGESNLLIQGQLAINDEDSFDLAIPNPSQYFLESFQDILVNEGIIVTNSKVISNFKTNDLGQEIAYIKSPFLSYFIQKLNRDSDNLFAETLLNLLGKSLDNSLELVKQNLTKLGVNPEGYNLVDGSGLSRHNLATPETFIQILQLMAKSSNAEIYKNSLAIAGVNGSLKNRFQNTSIQGNLKAKTGTLSGVVSLSGYLEIPNYQSVVFSIIVNHSHQTTKSLKKGVDEIVLVLGKLKRC